MKLREGRKKKKEKKKRETHAHELWGLVYDLYSQVEAL